MPVRLCLAKRWLLCVTLGLLLVACAARPVGPRAVPFPPPPKAPPPRGTVLEGRITGVPEDTRVTVQVRRLTGELSAQQPRWGSGQWRTILIQEPGEVAAYVVTVDVVGNVNEPPSYTIQVKGRTVVVSEAGPGTTTDPRHLDFQVRPAHAPPPASGSASACPGWPSTNV